MMSSVLSVVFQWVIVLALLSTLFVVLLFAWPSAWMRGALLDWKEEWDGFRNLIKGRT